MPVDKEELKRALAVLAENRGIKVTVKSSLNGAAIAGGTTFLGGILFGPVGFVIGATIGGTTAYMIHKGIKDRRSYFKGQLRNFYFLTGKFKPLASVLREDVTREDWEKLFYHLENAFADFGGEDIADLLSVLATNEDFQSIALKTITKELKMPITDNIF